MSADDEVTNIKDAIKLAIHNVIGTPAERAPVLNREPRSLIRPRIWHLIFERDGGVCWQCGIRVPKGHGEIDHLVPRSSFKIDDLREADRTTNLRLSCVPCNQDKSNFTIYDIPRTVGIVTVCWDCFERRGWRRPDPDLYPDLFSHWVEDHERPALTVQAFCGSCGLVSGVPDESWIE